MANHSSPFTGINPAAQAGADPAMREFEFTSEDFAKVQSLILDRAGIKLADHKHHMAYGRLSKRLRQLGLDNFSSYLQLLDRSPSDEWQHFVNALTTNLTYFYRESYHFETLAELFQRLRGQSVIRVWSCASSTGEEPYTIAMTAMEAFRTTTPPVQILATDIDTQVLDFARQGVYRLDTVTPVPEPLRRRYFLKGTGVNEGFARIKPEVQALVSFAQLNLQDVSWAAKGPFDAIFCRNVMIYFDRDVQMQILKRFQPMLSPDGLLFAGHSENLTAARDLFDHIGKTVYRPIRTPDPAKTAAR